MSVPAQFPTTTFTPVTGVSVILGTGGNTSQAQKKVLMLGVGLAAGTKNAGDLDEIFSGDEADTYYGEGSSLARMCRRAIEQGKVARIFGGFVADAGGAAARATITFAVGPQAGDATYEITIHGWTTSVSIPHGMTAANAATATIAAIQAHPYYGQMPITAAAGGAGVVNLTTKELNIEATTMVTNMRQDASRLVTLTATLNTAAIAGAGDLSLATILGVAATQRYDYIVACTSDSTNGGLLEAHLDTYVAPLHGMRQQGLIGSMDVPADVNTLAQAINAHRVEVVACELCEEQHYEIAAALAVDRAQEEAMDPATPYKYWPMQSVAIPFDPADYMLGTEVETALHSGVTPVQVINNQAYIPRMITSRSLTTGGGPDTTVLDTMAVTISDACADDIEADFSTRFMKKEGVAFKVMDDPAEGVTPPPFTATPTLIEDAAKEWVWRWYKQGRLQDPTSWVSTVSASLDAVDDTRINVSIPLYTIRGLMVLDIALFQK